VQSSAESPGIPGAFAFLPADPDPVREVQIDEK
jgi:hypothetical protein